MNQEAREHLDSILALEPEALTEAQTEFLKARRDYLTEEQKERYGLTEATERAEETSADVEDTSTEEAEAPRARRGRRAADNIEA